MRSAGRAALLGACVLLLGLWFLRPRVELQAIAGEVRWVGDDMVALAPDPGYKSFLGGLRRVPIAPVLALQLHAGDRISAELVSAPSGARRIGKLRFLGRAAPPPDATKANMLALGAVLPALTVPGIDGPLALGAGQGTATVLTFLYTSCGMPTACPLLAQKLYQLQQALRGHGRIVTITLDPDIDTLTTLRAYAQSHRADREIWKLGRLELAQLEPLLGQLGIARVRSEGTIVHGLQLAILDAEGRLAWRSEGSGWEPAELFARLRELSNKQANRQDNKQEEKP